VGDVDKGCPDNGCSGSRGCIVLPVGTVIAQFVARKRAIRLKAKLA
jgi:hypothetical protein